MSEHKVTMADLAALPCPDLLGYSKITDPPRTNVHYRASTVVALLKAERERYAPLMQAVEWLLEDGHMNQEHLARLRAAWEAVKP